MSEKTVALTRSQVHDVMISISSIRMAAEAFTMISPSGPSRESLAEMVIRNTDVIKNIVLREPV